MGKRQEHPICKWCGTALTEENWYEFHRNPKPRPFPSGKFYITRLYVCKSCWKLKVREKDQRRRARLNKADPLHQRTRYRGARLLWRGAHPERDTGPLRKRRAEQAEEISAMRILPNEGFTDILWLHNNHAAFDILARKGNQSYVIDVTTSPYKRFANLNLGNRSAVSWLVRNQGIRQVVLFVSPDFAHYVLKETRSGSAALTKAEIEAAAAIRGEW